MKKDWRMRFDIQTADEISAELDRGGYKGGDRFYVTFYDDGRLAAVHSADDDIQAQPWGPEIHTA